MSKCDFNKVAKQLYWNQTSAWMFSCKFAAYFQDIFSQEHLWMAVSGWSTFANFVSSKAILKNNGDGVGFCLEILLIKEHIQKQPFKGALRKRCSENI